MGGPGGGGGGRRPCVKFAMLISLSFLPASYFWIFACRSFPYCSLASSPTSRPRHMGNMADESSVVACQLRSD